MSNKYWHLADLEVDLRGSPRLRMIAAGLVLLAMLAICQSSLHWTGCVALSTLLVPLAWLDCQRHTVTARGQLLSRLCCQSGCWRLELENAETIVIEPQPGSVMLPWAVLLLCRFPLDGKQVRLLLGRDALSADDWRCLHLHLRQTLPPAFG